MTDQPVNFAGATTGLGAGLGATVVVVAGGSVVTAGAIVVVVVVVVASNVFETVMVAVLPLAPRVFHLVVLGAVRVSRRSSSPPRTRTRSTTHRRCGSR